MPSSQLFFRLMEISQIRVLTGILALVSGWRGKNPAIEKHWKLNQTIMTLWRADGFNWSSASILPNQSAWGWADREHRATTILAEVTVKMSGGLWGNMHSPASKRQTRHPAQAAAEGLSWTGRPCRNCIWVGGECLRGSPIKKPVRGQSMFKSNQQFIHSFNSPSGDVTQVQFTHYLIQDSHTCRSDWISSHTVLHLSALAWSRF